MGDASTRPFLHRPGAPSPSVATAAGPIGLAGSSEADGPKDRSPAQTAIEPALAIHSVAADTQALAAYAPLPI